MHGGTAIALRLGHRDSEDFGFFTENALNRRSLFEAIPALHAATPLQDQNETFVAFLDEVKVSFFGRIGFGRVGDPEVTADNVAVIASLRDLFAQKLKVVMQRVESKDYRDIAAMLRRGENLAVGMGGAAALFGVSFAAAQCAKALVYFKGGDLDTVPAADKEPLLDQVRRLERELIPSVPVLAAPFKEAERAGPLLPADASWDSASDNPGIFAWEALRPPGRKAQMGARRPGSPGSRRPRRPPSMSAASKTPKPPAPASGERKKERLFTLGIEEEFQIIDPETRELRSHIEQTWRTGR